MYISKMKSIQLLRKAVLAVFCILSTTMASKVSQVVEANNKFGMNCFKIASRDQDNVLISPYSAHVVLSMALQGAGGDTAESMCKVLQIPNAQTAADGYQQISAHISKVESVTLNTANKVYVMEKFKLKSNFKEMIVSKFSSEVDEMNFAENVKSAATINGWVEDKTNNKIKDLIKSDMLDADTRLVLVNALYFKGNWKQQFDKKLTEKQPFYLLNGEEIQADMMRLFDKKLNYHEDADLGCKILEIPYQGDEISMVILLPDERDGITKLQDKLANVNIADVVKQLHQTSVTVALPKFKIESTIPMTNMLKEMGAEIMFSNKANFSGIADSGESLKVSEVVQKTFIEVNEEGAEAAAATGMIMMGFSMPLPPRTFNANHPFIFALMDGANKNVLFVGRVFKI